MTIQPTEPGRRSTVMPPTTTSRATSAAWTWASCARRVRWCRPPAPWTSSSSSRRPTAHLYWLDLDRLLHGTLDPLDTRRTHALARFLAETHATKRDEPTLYARRIRELVGHGECVMGILDSYPHPSPVLPPAACEALEVAMVHWRWRLRDRAHRLSRTHGDFHPWNILFREGTDFSLLDRSRGEWGEPADDVAALAINYLFFGMRKAAAHGERGVAEPFRGLFHDFLNTYIQASRDYELLETLPPFLAFRALVLAHPRWYPDLPDTVRSDLAHLARSLTRLTRFDPADVSWLCGVAPMSWAIWITGLPGCGKSTLARAAAARLAEAGAAGCDRRARRGCVRW